MRYNKPNNQQKELKVLMDELDTISEDIAGYVQFLVNRKPLLNQMLGSQLSSDN